MVNKIGILLLSMIGCFLIFSLLVFLYRYRKSWHYQRAIQKQANKKAKALESQQPEDDTEEEKAQKNQASGEISGHVNRHELFKETPEQVQMPAQPEIQETPFCSEHFEIIQSITKTDAVDIPDDAYIQTVKMPDEVKGHADPPGVLDIKETDEDQEQQ